MLFILLSVMPQVQRTRYEHVAAVSRYVQQSAVQLNVAALELALCVTTYQC